MDIYDLMKRAGIQPVIEATNAEKRAYCDAIAQNIGEFVELVNAKVAIDSDA